MFLGIDGGGTKTAFCLLSGDGEVLAGVETGSTYRPRDPAAVAAVLAEGVEEVCRSASVRPGDIAFAFAGLPGYGEVLEDVPALDGALDAVLDRRRYRCDNDMLCGWAGSLGVADGINVISGTGSMTYGRRRGVGVRVGGWGEVFGDEGSAYWIAVRGLNAASRMSDGRLPEGPLLGILRRHLGLAADHELIDVVVHRWHAERARIAGLSRQVAAAADAGDAAATSILDEAGSQLAELVEATRRRLPYDEAEVAVVSWSGGAFAAPPVLDAFAARLSGGPRRFELHPPRYAPVVGAALLAASLAGTPLDRPALARLAQGW